MDENLFFSNSRILLLPLKEELRVMGLNNVGENMNECWTKP